MDQLMDDGQLHVVQHLAKRQLVIGRVQDPYLSRFLAFIPAYGAQCLRLQFAEARRRD